MVYDFVEVTKASKRMCDSNNCSNCPASSDNNGADVSCSNFRFDMPEKYAELVLKWAKENPEKVYPTWLELAAQQGFKIEEGKQCTDEKQLLILLMASVNTPIPADTAQKLGIHPVPIVHSDCGATNAEEARKRLGIESKEN